MKLDNGVVGFNDFWYDCQISTELSVLTSVNKELKDKLFAYNNFYKYVLEEYTSDHETKFWALKTEEQMDLSDAFNTVYYCDSKKVDHVLRMIKWKLWKKEYVYAAVDLFYLLPGTYVYNKFHWNHYTFLTGYDVFRKKFYALEHTLAHGYRAYEIPEDRFRTALLNTELTRKLFVNRLNKAYEFREITLNEILDQARELKKNISEILDGDKVLFKMLKEDYEEEYLMDLGCQYLFAIMNHMKANKHMFEQLYEKGMIDQQIFDQVLERCNGLIDGWNFAKISLGKLYKNPMNREENNKTLNRYVRELFRQEIEMWNELLKGGEESEEAGRCISDSLSNVEAV